MPVGTTRSGERRRAQILDGALRCFDRQGVSATTIEDIRLESQASVGSIYHHLGGKDDIVAELYSRAVSDYRDGLMAALRSWPEPKAALRSAVDFHTHWMESHGALARFMLRWDESEIAPSGRAKLRAEARRFGKDLGAWLAKGVEAGHLRPLVPELYASLLMGPLLEYARCQVFGRTTVSLGEARETLADGLWRVLGRGNSE